jgi:two-component system sensor histidine kinase VicK
MEPGVPFALLGAVQLLLVAAFVALGAAAVVRRSAAGFVVLLGALVLAGVEVRTGLRLGVVSSDGLALLRAAGFLVVAAGLATGGLGRNLMSSRALGIVLPLASTGGPAAFAALGAAAAAVVAAFERRGRTGLLLAGGFGLLAAGSAVSPGASDDPKLAVLVLCLRGAGAVLLLVALVVLAQASLLTKVVSAILAGVLAMAVASVGVVGNVVVSSYDKQTRQVVEEAAGGRQQSLFQLGQSLAGQAQTLDFLRSKGTDVGGVVNLFKFQQHDFALVLDQRGQVLSTGGSASLLPSERLGLARLPMVHAVLTGFGSTRQDFASGVVRLGGTSPSLAMMGVGVSSQAPRLSTAKPSPPQAVVIYGRRLDSDFAGRDVDTGGFGLTLLAGDPLTVVASNKSQRTARQVRALIDRDQAGKGVDKAGLTIGSQGTNPTVRVIPLTNTFDPSTQGLLAVSRDPGPALDTERRALEVLLVTALLALLLVAVAAVALGRRTVEPVRRLTDAAERVAAGDLTVTTGVTSRDEVGTLSRTFDGMTSSLLGLTDDLRESAARLETVLASMTEGLLATDAEGVVTSTNRAALEMLGLEELDVLGERLSLVADVRDADGAPLADVGLRLRDEPGTVHRADGTTVPVQVSISPLLGEQDAGVVLVLRDTTQEREVERMKTDFLSNVSHELRTPLTPIRGYADILISKTNLQPEQVGTFATVIRDEALKMNRVVDLLVDVAAIEAGRVSVNPRPIAVRELLDVRLAAWQTRAPARAKDLKRRAATGLPKVYVDPTWIGKALDELVDNAVKYTPPGTAITLLAAWSPDHTRVRLSVKDAGPGIAEGDQATLFTSFEQVDGSATRRVGGLGLGLSFVRRLAQDAGYPLAVSSRLGKGAEFSLDVPVA